MISALLLSTAFAQETLDLGRISDDDITVVQKVLFPKEGRTELGVHLGVMPFDPFLVTPNLQLSFESHQSDRLALSVLVGGGYGLQNSVARQLGSPAYGVRPFAYRYLGSALAGVQYAPVYAKMNLNGANVVHFDIYGTLRGGLTLERSIIPDGSFALGPTVSPGVGMRFWWKANTALRFEVRDDVLLERRALTRSWHIKQNAGITLGITTLSKVKSR